MLRRRFLQFVAAVAVFGTLLLLAVACYCIECPCLF